ncbi:tetratricopeptide repeat protein [Azospirillum sp. Sh1]|uniref:tetratricopeptide repeat protein n=1 Tax=Azospirillum sp. Sh1 TaxID=2607285 RepID=UPI0011EDE51F|nr:tetratricopeptide repeat protein [Azospirillum sp. Sh1]KAA0569434.1 sel1 repeat family protein [Azospirillum sp. Sh1]
MRTLLAVTLAVTLFLPIAATASEFERSEDDSAFGDLTIDYYRDVVRRYPERLGLYCWVGYETYKSGDFQQAKEVFETCAERNHAQSMIFLSQIYTDGLGVPRDPAIAARWMLRAAETGYAAAQYDYGLTLLRGDGIPCDLDAGKEWIRKAAVQGDVNARELAAAGFDLSVIPAAERSTPSSN